MKKKLLLLLSLALVFTLTACFGNYLEGYRKYSKTVGTYDLYYKILSNEDECPNEAGQLYTLYSTEGNTFKYDGILTGGGCYVELLASTGSGFSSIADLLRNENITVSELEAVTWTFDFTIKQTPDYTVGTVNYIEYFQEISDYEVYIIDYGTTICHDGGSVVLFEYNGVEYDVQGAPTGDGCISEYFIYYIEETADDSEADAADTTDDDSAVATTGVLITVNEALHEGYVSIADINRATFESEIFETFREPQILATDATIYFVVEAQEYNQTNPYTLSATERNSILSILANTKYQFVADAEASNASYTTLIDNDSKQHLFKIYDTHISASTEETIAILTLSDVEGSEYTYLLYNTGIQIFNEDINAYANYLNQTYIIDLLGDLDE